MSPKLPALTGPDLIAVLEAKGWYVARVKGSHHVMAPSRDLRRDPGTGARQDTLKRGTLAGILRNAGIDRAELLRLFGP